LKGLTFRRMIGRHIYDNIADSIDEVLHKFKIKNKTTFIVTDNVANFVIRLSDYPFLLILHKCILYLYFI